MSDPKRHHYVPQFYLRRFSTTGRSIICFHKASRRLIEKASIKGQCAIDNFYAWDDAVEPALGVAEGRAASLFRDIDKTRSLPGRKTLDWQEILIFISLQSSRTQLSGRDTDEMADYYFKLRASGDPDMQGIDLDKFRFSAKFPAALPMQIALDGYPILNELDRCLLINKSKVPFLLPTTRYYSTIANIAMKEIWEL